MGSIHDVIEAFRQEPANSGPRDEVRAAHGPASHFEFTPFMTDLLPNLHLLDTEPFSVAAAYWMIMWFGRVPGVGGPRLRR